MNFPNFLFQDNASKPREKLFLRAPAATCNAVTPAACRTRKFLVSTARSLGPTSTKGLNGFPRLYTRVALVSAENSRSFRLGKEKLNRETSRADCDARTTACSEFPWLCSRDTAFMVAAATLPREQCRVVSRFRWLLDRSTLPRGGGTRRIADGSLFYDASRHGRRRPASLNA